MPTETESDGPNPPTDEPLPATDRTVYLVIHGVGDPEFGDTIRALAGGLTYHDAAFVAAEDQLWLPEPDPTGGVDERTARSFPVPILRDDGNRRVLAEVHWADLSRFAVSLLGVVEGAFSLLFGLRDVAYQAVHKLPGCPAKVLRGCVWLSTRLLMGPLAAANLLGFFLLAAAVVADQWVPAGYGGFGGRAGAVAGFVACVTALLAGVVVWYRSGPNDMLWLLGVWLAAAAGFVIVFVLAQTDFSARWGWVVACLVVLTIGAAACWWARTDAHQLLGGVVAAAAVVGLTVVLASIVPDNLGGIWELPYLDQLKQRLEEWRLPPDAPREVREKEPHCIRTGGVVGYVAAATVPMWVGFVGALGIIFFGVLASLCGLCSGRPIQRSMQAAAVLPFVMLCGWCLAVPGAWLVITPNVPGTHALRAAYQLTFQFAVSTAPAWVLLALLVGIAVGVDAGCWWVRRRRLGRVPVSDLRTTPDDGVRRIVSEWVVGALLIGLVLVVSLFVATLFSTGMSATEPARRWLFAVVWGPGVAFILAAVTFLATQFLPLVRFVLDLMFDVVNHFRFPAGRPDDFPTRRAMAHRLTAVVRHFADRETGGGAPPCHLVVVGHSQGTMVAIDVFNRTPGDDPALAAAIRVFASVRLVTMGSPFGHLYQHYFAHHYPPLGHEHWDTLFSRLTGWLNVYRVDDYVGRGIDPDERPGLVNHPVPPNGHTGYWTDEVVLAEVFPPPPPSPPPPPPADQPPARA